MLRDEDWQFAIRSKVNFKAKNVQFFQPTACIFKSMYYLLQKFFLLNFIKMVFHFDVKMKNEKIFSTTFR